MNAHPYRLVLLVLAFGTHDRANTLLGIRNQGGGATGEGRRLIARRSGFPCRALLTRYYVINTGKKLGLEKAG